MQSKTTAYCFTAAVSRSLQEPTQGVKRRYYSLRGTLMKIYEDPLQLAYLTMQKPLPFCFSLFFYCTWLAGKSSLCHCSKNVINKTKNKNLILVFLYRCIYLPPPLQFSGLLWSTWLASGFSFPAPLCYHLLSPKR